MALPIGQAEVLTGQLKVTAAEAIEHETDIKAKRIIKLPSNQQTQIEYSGDNPIYVGTAPRGLATATTGWLIQKITYSGSNPTVIQIAYDSWANRATASYS